MAREKKPVHKVQMTEGKRNIIHQLLKEYDIQSAEDIQDALKDLLGGTIKEMMEAEMDDHLGYEKSQRSDSGDYRNGYKRKRVTGSCMRKMMPTQHGTAGRQTETGTIIRSRSVRVWGIWKSLRKMKRMR